MFRKNRQKNINLIMTTKMRHKNKLNAADLDAILNSWGDNLRRAPGSA